MRSNFIRAARQLLLGPSLAAGLLAPAFARAEPVSPDIQNIPITRIDNDALFTFASQQVSVSPEDMALAHGSAGLTSFAIDNANENILVSLDANGGAGKEKLKAFLVKKALENMTDQPVQSSILVERGIENFSTLELVGLINNAGPHALHLKHDTDADASCIDFLSADPDILWRDMMDDLGVKTQRHLPSVAKFVNDHESRHCQDPRLEDNGLNISEENSVELVLDTEITADLAAAHNSSDNLPLLRGVARYRVMEAAVSTIMLGGTDRALDHSSAFELWRYIATLDGGKESHPYLDKQAMKDAFHAFSEDIASIVGDSEYTEQLAAFYPAGDDINKHMFSNLYVVARAMLESDKFTKPESILIAKEYISSFEYFDAAFETDFKGKVTKIFKATSDDQVDSEPSVPVATYQSTTSTVSARP